MIACYYYVYILERNMLIKKSKSLILSDSFLKILLKLSFTASLIIFFIDFFTYSGAVKNNFYLSPLAIAGLVMLFHLFARLKWKIIFGHNFSQTLLLFAAPTLASMAVAAHILEQGLYYQNYFLKNFEVHYWALFPLALGLIGFAVIHASLDFFKKYRKHLFFLVTLWLIVGAGMLYLINPELYRVLAREDGLIEYSQFFGFLAAGVLSLLMIRYQSLFAQSQKGQTFFKLLCILAAIAFFIVVKEEISWGQRIIGIETPETIKEQNLQDEITLHNLEIFWPFVYHAYQKIGLYGALAGFFAWIIKDILPKKTTVKAWVKLLAPDMYLFLNFFFIAAYVWLRHRHGPWKYVLWEEFGEFLLVGGIVAHLIQRFFYFKRLKKTKDS